MKPADRVRAEIRTRRLSVAEAARLTPEPGRLSGQAWSDWLGGAGDTPAPKMTRAIAAAFNWPLDWPENPPPLDVILPADDPAVENLTRRIQKLETQLAEVLALLRDMIPGQVGPGGTNGTVCPPGDGRDDAR